MTPRFVSRPVEYWNVTIRVLRNASLHFWADLGWEHWILYPEQITYVACASCRHTRDLVSPRCRQDRPTKGSRTGKRSCCKAVKTVWIPIVYVDEDLSLVTSNIPLTEECGW
ncbi:hypothetical protein chiPu_0021335 [Chiloscyllium punctatum]|uniref:TGF-beta family profile domain-containing protein n=1 Tax=Chiloscyllium punctatum TaxID=137246 RepID=A0A401RQ44_CHIPU|nr:hypothetical protein [Chiloscyllium punctatum]